MAEDLNSYIQNLLPNLQKSVTGNIPAGSSSGDVSQALDLLQLQHQPKITTVGSSIQQLQKLLEQDTAAQQKYGQIADTKITEIGNQLSQNLGLGVKATGDIFSGAASKVQQGYQAADKSMGDLTQGLTGGLSSLAQGLGQGQALSGYGNPIERLNAQSIANRTGAQASGAAAQGNLNTLGATMQGIGQQGIANSQQEYAGKRADVAKMVAGNIADLQIKTGQGIQDLLDNLTDIAMNYGAEFRTTLSQVTSARTEAEREAANDQLANMVKQMQLAKGAQDLQQGEQSMALAAGRYGMDQAKFGMAQESHGLDVLGKNIRNQKGMNELTGTPTKGEYKGRKGLDQWLADTGQRGYFSGSVRRIVGGAPDEAAAMSAEGMNKVGSYDAAVQYLNSLPRSGNQVQLPKPAGVKGPLRNYRFDVNDLMTALDIYYGKYGSVK